MQFSPQAFNQFLGPNGNIGQQYAWYQSFACPCVDPHSGAANPSCPLCIGRGRQYAAPVNGVAGIAGQRAQREWAQFGVYEQGDLVITIPSASPVYAMGQFDRVTALNTQQVFSLVLTSGDPLERLWTTTSVIGVTRVFWLTPDGTAVVEGGIPTVNADGTLAWPNGGEPPAGAQYTITGTKMLDYYAFGMFPTNRNFQQGLALPRKIALRDFDLFNR
ncbi:hypothetical protein GNZ12_24155 [Paraburkholderia sp. 1N]|uniref:Uncharacterized protein n=1 Tax=Paraburkholderia solitsugae TaxID=2675748 RepID=A0ABX2BU03_9BURK|nr:hypothetical protein [Paraburkholderia solitsugae]NPT44347.1 hypothetical protein [Paraburkholderia solitsugae]